MKRQSITERVRGILKARKEQLEKEIKYWRHKMNDTESFWGMGGPYRRQEQALEAREAELEELEEFERQLGRYIPKKEISMYGLYCRNCGTITLISTQPTREWHECPACKKMIYENNPERKTFRIEDEGQLWLKAFEERKREE